MAKFRLHQVVRVQAIPTRQDAFLFPAQHRLPKIGDRGTVVDIYGDPHEGYCVESVAADGQTEWLVDFLPEELEPA